MVFKPIFWILLLPLVGSAINQQVYKGLYTNEIRKGEITIPRKVSSLGEDISHNVTTFHNKDNNEPVHFNVTISNKNHLLVVHPAKHFLAPGMIVERHRRNVHVRIKAKQGSIDCHYQGTVYGQPNSRVAISACNGLTGLIHTENEKYFIEPLHHHSKNIHAGHKHLIYKRSAVTNHMKRKRKKKRKRNSKNCGTRDPKRMAEIEWFKQIGKVRVQEKRHKHKEKISFATIHNSNLKKHKYKNIKRHRKRSVSIPQFVETLLVADASMVEFHEDGDIETYLLTIMNMVSSLYLDPSIGNLIKVVVVKIILIDEPLSEPELNVTTNADATLRNFCRWQKSLNPDNDSHPHHHDVAILVTRKDICARHDTPCSTLGVAHVGGMCKSGRSCSVNEDNGITLAHTITHEMGHNFGMYHDTDKIGCKGKEGNKLHIMTPSFEADTVEVSWSRCSRRDITSFIDKGLADCLEDAPSEEDLTDYSYPDLPAGALYNAEYQCRLQFGADASVCTPLQEICSRLWCQVNGTCTTQLRPAAPGTHCGKHMWCQEKRCVPIMEPPIAIDGGWGEWSSWSECSRSCGAGVSIMQRECDHPKPAAGGRFCVGERRRYRICNTDPCPDNQATFRAMQCSSFDSRTYEGKTYTWVPYFDQDEPCELYCSDLNDTLIVPWGEHALDGTPCNVGTRDVCISGICRKVGCDWIVDSTAIEDACGICQGDGTTCDTIEGVYSKQSLGAGYREMLIIPAGSRNIRIEEIDYSDNYISIGSATSKKFYLNGKRHITLPGEYTVAGAQTLYERDNELEKIRIPGPLQESILLYIIFRGKTFNPGIKYQFTMAKKEPPKQVKYIWILGDWSQCSVTCGSGVQSRRPLCQESVSPINSTIIEGTSVIVDESLCDANDEPTLVMRTCNEESCPYHWWIGPWQSCPVTCTKMGEKQYRRRSIMCVDGLEMAFPDHFCAASTRPKERELCKSLSICQENIYRK